jgi:hypothetical protein
MGIKGMRIERRPPKVLWPICQTQYANFVSYRREINSYTALGYMAHGSSFARKGWRVFE